VSVGGFLILAEIEFEPLMKIYAARDVTIKTVGHTVGV
jgi:hypothetical protein